MILKSLRAASFYVQIVLQQISPLNFTVHEVSRVHQHLYFAVNQKKDSNWTIFKHFLFERLRLVST